MDVLGRTITSRNRTMLLSYGVSANPRGLERPSSWLCGFV